MADALAAAERRRAVVSKVSTPPPAAPKKRHLKKTPEDVHAVSSTEKVTPDPKAVRTDPEPRQLFPTVKGTLSYIYDILLNTKMFVEQTILLPTLPHIIYITIEGGLSSSWGVLDF